ncbi:MAG: histidinol dehydrogenase, partial [Spirochaetaceae bacterium]|nr:histidinol dehydrogenase [Spirochaetaceae bacterium]
MGLDLIKQAHKKAAGRDEELTRTAREIINNVRARGEKALLDYTEQFDKARLGTVRVDRETVLEAYDKTPAQTVEALKYAHRRIKN